MPGEAPEPRLSRIERLVAHGEAAALDDLLDPLARLLPIGEGDDTLVTVYRGMIDSTYVPQPGEPVSVPPDEVSASEPSTQRRAQSPAAPGLASARHQFAAEDMRTSAAR